MGLKIYLLIRVRVLYLGIIILKYFCWFFFMANLSSEDVHVYSETLSLVLNLYLAVFTLHLHVSLHKIERCMQILPTQIKLLILSTSYLATSKPMAVCYARKKNLDLNQIACLLH